ncbi:helix-turn-helix domain-containing protein [Rhodococcus ruber]|uniref:helix-turn-helix domain-containing protein n=1 Tax=Rhodococcus ruber TaxID=1830 RepID=UPI0009DA846D|nr:helix-turn-helix transcriptional regulator [Rhodococcus ruber]
MTFEQIDQFLGAEIRAARARRRMSHEELGAAVRLTKATVSRVENSQRSVKAEHLVCIGIALGVPAAELLAIARQAHDAAEIHR